MPTKKSTKKTTKSAQANKSDSFDFQKLVNGSDSYKNLIYGIVTVVVLFIVIALGIRTLQQNKAQIDEGVMTQNLDQENLTSKYTVTEGDTLWSIAEKTYNDGFKWNEIAKANNITNASTLEKGTELTIPKLTTEPRISQAVEEPAVSPTAIVEPSVPASPTTSPTIAPTTVMTSPGQKITGSNYTVVAGDTLWDIAIRSYGDGYRWVEIARQNNLANPDLIYIGNVLKLARP